MSEQSSAIPPCFFLSLTDPSLFNQSSCAKITLDKDICSTPSSGLDLLDSGSDGLCPLASWTESHGAGLRTVSARDAVAILPYTELGCCRSHKTYTETH